MGGFRGNGLRCRRCRGCRRTLLCCRRDLRRVHHVSTNDDRDYRTCYDEQSTAPGGDPDCLYRANHAHDANDESHQGEQKDQYADIFQRNVHHRPRSADVTPLPVPLTAWAQRAEGGCSICSTLVAQQRAGAATRPTVVQASRPSKPQGERSASIRTLRLAGARRTYHRGAPVIAPDTTNAGSNPNWTTASKSNCWNQFAADKPTEGWFWEVPGHR